MKSSQVLAQARMGKMLSLCEKVRLKGTDTLRSEGVLLKTFLKLYYNCINMQHDLMPHSFIMLALFSIFFQYICQTVFFTGLIALISPLTHLVGLYN